MAALNATEMHSGIFCAMPSAKQEAEACEWQIDSCYVHAEVDQHMIQYCLRHAHHGILFCDDV